MLIQTKTVKIGKRDVVLHVPVREYWHEWFRIEMEAGYTRSFYFPLERSLIRGTTICWIWYLVPFVLPIRLFSVAFMTILKDSRELLLTWEENLKDKRKYPLWIAKISGDPNRLLDVRPAKWYEKLNFKIKKLLK